VPAADIAERTNLPDLHEDGSCGMEREGHAGFNAAGTRD
jgi:hypothetical protein